MKTRIYLGIILLIMGLSVASCDDDNDFAVSTTPVLNDSSVVTGSSEVTATTATLNGSVSDLGDMSASAYAAGFFYGSAQENLTESITAKFDGNAFSATLTNLSNNSTLYYQAFVRLQGKVYYKGEVKSLVTTNAKVSTKSATAIDYASAKLGGSVADYPTDATCGIVISTLSDVEAVRAGLMVKSATLSGDFAVERGGLLPGTLYYYAAYLDLGSGVIYGDVESFVTPTYSFDLDNDLVDLGLSVKWARFNVGAKNATDLGGLFGFGDLTGCNNSIHVNDYPTTEDTYKTAYDIANVVYDGKVTLPTAADFEELFSICTSEWTEQDGVAGFKLTGPNGNSIFLPAAGSRIMNDITDQGAKGIYMTGTVNSSNTDFALSYEFTSGTRGKTTTARYQAVAVRPISTAKNIPLEKELLYKTWEIDLNTDGSYITFAGPSYFYGMDDSWATVTNGEPIVGDSWNWAADFAGNSWVVGGSANNCRGYMTFLKEDGVDKVVVSQVTTEGTFVESKGTFTIDEENKTLTLDIDVLAPANYVPNFVDNKKTDIKILSLTKSSMQLAVVRTDPSQGPCLLSINYIPQLEKYGYTAKLTCYGDGGAPDEWNSAVITIPGGEAALGAHTITFNAQGARTNGKVYVIDIEGFSAAYPNAMVRVDAIKADGKEVKFDANKFFYGDIEDKGNYRVEMANIWGYGHNDSWDGLKDTPFQKGGGETTNETALAFNSTFEVTFTIASLTSNGAGVYTPNLITINPDWLGPWDFNKSATFEVKYENFRYSVANPSLSIKYESDIHAAGSIMTFVQVANIHAYFPGMHATLDKFYLDGNAITFDATKVIDTNNSSDYRLELWNCYGATKGAGCAFGTPDGDVLRELGFSTSMELQFTFQTLFAVPDFAI